MPHLTSIILTYNESAHIADCINSVQFADAIVVFDSFSTDDTVAVAQQHGAIVLQNSFKDYASQRNAALDAVTDKTDWVLFVDADERVTAALAQEIRRSIQASDDIVGWQIPRYNNIFGKVALYAGWYPDYQTRLLKVGAAHYDPEKLVHEVVLLKGALGTLHEPLIHYNYRDMAQFGAKQRRYSAYDAEILYQQGAQVKPWTLITMPLRHFYWRYVTLNGYQGGWHGLLLSVLMARYEFRKYWLLSQHLHGAG